MRLAIAIVCLAISLLSALGQNSISLKAGHLIGLLPDQPPLFVGLQEIGNDQDVQSLARSAKARYHHNFQPLFVQGKDTATK